MSNIHLNELKDTAPRRPINDTKDIIIAGLKAFFSKHSEYTWSPNAKESKISIAEAFSTDKDQNESRPSIAIRRNPFQWRNRHLDQQLYNNLQNRVSKIDILSGSFDILSAATEGLEADRVAEDVFLFFTWFRTQISEKGLFDIKNVQLLTEEKMRSGAETDIVIVPVRILVETSQSWETVEFAHELKDIVTTIKV